MGRLLAVIGGVVWLLAIALFATAVHWSERPRRLSPLTPTPTLLRELNAARNSGLVEGESWIVTKVTSAHHVLVVNVNADRVSSAQEIAMEIVAPVHDRGFDEVLVYVWNTHARKSYADRRIQWTPHGGYSELVIGD
jgi:hypothetical protein